MRSLPGSLDGSQGDVRTTSQDGESPNFAIEDQRRAAADPVYAVFEGRDPAWEDRLVAEAGRGLRVSLVWSSGQRLDGVVVLQAYVPRSQDLLATALDDPELGIDRDGLPVQFNEGDEPSSLDAVELRDRPPGPLAGWDLPVGRRYVAVTKSTIASTRPSANAMVRVGVAGHDLGLADRGRSPGLRLVDMIGVGDRHPRLALRVAAQGGVDAVGIGPGHLGIVGG